MKKSVVYNTPVQGGAAEVLLVAMTRLDQAMVDQACGEAVQPVAVIHDEIILEARSDWAGQAKTMLETAMVEAMLEVFPDAPTRDLVEAHIGSSWADK